MGAATEVIFVPGDPPRAGMVALWGGGPDQRVDGKVELVRPVGGRVRRAQVPAQLVPVADAIGLLTRTVPVDASASYRGWATAALAGVALVARGRLVPARSDEGYGAWRVGPLDPADREWLRSLAAGLPPEAYALPLAGPSPLRLRSPEHLVRAFWDAIADTFVRTEAAELEVRAPAFAADTPAFVEGPTGWLSELEQVDRAGATVALRVEPPRDDVDDPDDPEDAANADPLAGFRVTLHLRSAADPSLLVPVSQLWKAPQTVLARLGDRAEIDLALGLRRGARVWTPLGRALRATTPVDVELAPDEVESLLTDGSAALDASGIEVLWPKELFGGGLEVRAALKATKTPAGAQPAAFSLDQLLEVDWRPTIDGEPLTAAEIAVLAGAKRSLVRVRGRWVRVSPDLVERLRRRARRPLRAIEALAASLSGEIEIDGEVVAFESGGTIAALAERLREAGSAEHDLEPSTDLLATLRPYQRRGLAWLAHVAELGVGGCLADDMGLGKTLQLIALHLHRRVLGLGPTLVVCPTTLLGTWHRELDRFAPSVPVRRYHGTGRHLDDLAPDEIVLTTYGVLRQDHVTLGEAGWGLAVADEAQHAKNPHSRTARALRAVPAPARIALTGTPVENRLSELWSILDWTTPGLLGSLEGFRRAVAVPVERYRDADATARLARVTRPFLLRRRKIDPGIAPELPPKTESDLVVGLTAEQASLYQAVVDEVLAEIAATEGIQRRGLVLRLLTSLKQVCNHPAQYLHEPGPIAGRSGKLAALDELLEIITDEGESVLVFTQYVEMARLIETHLATRGVPTLFLHGGVSASRREQMVADFQAGTTPVFLLSLKAGGVGITLTRATHVVHFDRWWNPAVEDQATDRAYRIGQDRPVQVHRFITEGTLEDKIAKMIESKRALAEAVVGSGEGWLSELSDHELADLVSLGAER